MLVGNKKDLKKMRQVDREEATEFCKQNKLFFIETSALADTNVQAAFETIIKEIYRLVSRKNITNDSIANSANASVGNIKGQSVVLSEDSEKQAQENASKKKCC
jgi:Ras-related protein Rab-11A